MLALKMQIMKIAELQTALIQMRQLIMSHLIWIYAVCPLVFELSV